MSVINFPVNHHAVQTKVAEKPQIFDLLQLSRNERKAREKCLESIRALQAWEETLSVYAVPAAGIRSRMLRRDAHASIKIYKIIRQNRIRLFKNYMDELPKVGISKRLAS